VHPGRARGRQSEALTAPLAAPRYGEQMSDIDRAADCTPTSRQRRSSRAAAPTNHGCPLIYT
jgi:hypothetical protein